MTDEENRRSLAMSLRHFLDYVSTAGISAWQDPKLTPRGAPPVTTAPTTVADWYDDPNAITSLTWLRHEGPVTEQLCATHLRKVLAALRVLRLGAAGTPNRSPDARCDRCTIATAKPKT